MRARLAALHSQSSGAGFCAMKASEAGVGLFQAGRVTRCLPCAPGVGAAELQDEHPMRIRDNPQQLNSAKNFRAARVSKTCSRSNVRSRGSSGLSATETHPYEEVLASPARKRTRELSEERACLVITSIVLAVAIAALLLHLSENSTKSTPNQLLHRNDAALSTSPSIAHIGHSLRALPCLSERILEEPASLVLG